MSSEHESYIWLSAMSASRLFSILLVLLVFMAPILLLRASSSEDGASSAIKKAEEGMVSAYQAVLEAERAGANTSSLVSRLNVAAEYLAQAHILFRAGDLNNATRFADLCFENAEKVRPEANQLRNKASMESGIRFRFTMVGSVVSVCLISIAGFLSWRVFKRRYYERFLRMKPEVVSDES